MIFARQNMYPSRKYEKCILKNPAHSICLPSSFSSNPSLVLPGMYGVTKVNKSSSLCMDNSYPVIKGEEQWSCIKGSELRVRGWSTFPLRTRQSSWTLWPCVCFSVKFKKKLSEVLNNKFIPGCLRMDLFYRKLNWSLEALTSSSFKKAPVSHNLTQGLFSLYHPLLHLCLWNSDFLKPLKHHIFLKKDKYHEHTKFCFFLWCSLSLKKKTTAKTNLRFPTWDREELKYSITLKATTR